jgi:hypothetical protein
VNDDDTENMIKQQKERSAQEAAMANPDEPSSSK